ncbi:MAG: hypothetical protein GY913_01940 [Proteobacteria bacterium]|nr:hypothetical protein [Pseudomonadota bacterium]MCP4915659.1 hypothetical protein [Pseudomonadota bacterium]
MLSTLRDRALRRLRDRVEEHLSARLEPAQSLRHDADSMKQAIAGVEARIERLERARDARSAPFSGDMTVHAAWARHPGVAAIFTARGLPGCPACAVGQDETLAEVADGYGFPLQLFLAELEDLLTG